MKVFEIDNQSPYLSDVKALGKANAQTLGFFPEGAFDDHAKRGHILVAVDQDENCVGYLLYRVSQDRAIIVHLCIDCAKRRKGVARKLVEYLQQITKDLYGIGLRCRRDYEASNIWPRLGFIAQSEQPGRAKERTDLTFWWFDHGHPTLFSEPLMESLRSKIRVVMDANVFFDLYDKKRSGYEESNALLADWLSDSLQLCLTDEIYNEIHRSNDEGERKKARELIHNFAILPCQQEVLTTAVEELRQFFPENMCTRDEADLRQLARTIASNAHFFLTRDGPLLSLKDKVYDSFGIRIIRATDLIIELDELRREAEYQPQRLAGTLSEIQRVQSGQEDILTARFQCSSSGEARSAFQQRLRRLLSDPERYSCSTALDTKKTPIALFAYDKDNLEILDIPLLRIAHSPLAATLARYLIFRSVSDSAHNKCLATRISDPYQDEVITSALSDDAFVRQESGWLKINLSEAKSARKMSDYLLKLSRRLEGEREYCQELASILGKDTATIESQVIADIERLLWPAKILDAYLPTFIVPIRPEWAKELFDEGLAGQTLFGAKDELALNREGVYYRAKLPSGGLRAPGRILWYVSYEDRFVGTGRLRACSRLDEVILDKPKNLYRRFRRLGVYEWNHISQLARGDTDSTIMALRFSDTEPFACPIEWRRLQEILRENGCKSQLQSPVGISPEVFSMLYVLGKQIQVEDDVDAG
jgi:predicted nucleic acid-binding protein